MRRIAFLLLLIWGAAPSCKSPSSGHSGLASVISKDPLGSSQLIVYYKETSGDERVYRKACAPTSIATPASCPTTPPSASRAWKDYQAALLQQGLSSPKVRGIKDALESTTAWDSTGLDDIMKKMEQAFGVDVETESLFTAAYIGTPKSGTVAIPMETTTSMPLAKDLVLAEMQDAHDWFFTTDTLYHGGTHPYPGDVQVSDSVFQSCLANAPGVPYWSDIVFYYYCQLGHLRSCFTGIVHGAAKTYDTYKNAYDKCLASDPEFHRYFAGDTPGIDYDRRHSVFQHVMFSVYASGGVNVFDRNDQDDVINRFYGSESDCSLRPYLPRSSSDPLYRPRGSHCGSTSSSGGGGSSGTVTGALVSTSGHAFYRIPVRGVMSDDNIRKTCEAAGKKVPCNNGQDGQFSDSVCVDTGIRDGADPMNAIATALGCSNPRVCAPLDGAYQYMGNKWFGGNSCGSFSRTWCARGLDISDKDAICAD